MRGSVASGLVTNNTLVVYRARRSRTLCSFGFVATTIRQSAVGRFFCAKATEEFLSSKGKIGLPCSIHVVDCIVRIVRACGPPGEVLRDGSILVHVTSGKRRRPVRQPGRQHLLFIQKREYNCTPTQRPTWPDHEQK